MKKVAIIGAGYGGLRAVEHLANKEGFELYLFDCNSYHYLQTEAYGYIAGRFDLHDVVLDLRNWSHGFEQPVTFIQEKVTFIDSTKQRIATAKSEYDYDYIILATGARTNFFSFIDGLKQHGLGVKRLFRAHRFRTEFEEMLYEKLQDSSQQGQTINLAIGGAGLSGVEIAAEMADVIQHHSKSIGEAASEITIHLIDASDTILPSMSDYIIEHTQTRLEALGVQIRTNAFIQSVDARRIYFKDGNELEYTFMIFTGGIVANRIIMDIEPQTNRIAQYLCDDTLRVDHNIFAIGDCCELKDTQGTILPPTAQTAEKSAEYAAYAITQLEQNRELKPFRGKVDGIFVALGGSYAVGELFGFIKVRGYVAHLLKKLITKSYYIGLKLRLNTGFKRRTKLS